MLSSAFFKQSVAKSLVLLMIQAVIVSLANGQAHPNKQVLLSPHAEQVLETLLSGIPIEDRRLVLNAVQALGPDRAEAKLLELEQLDPSSRDFLSRMGRQVIAPGLRLVPPQRHQAFVDGLLGVSESERDFAMQVLKELVRSRNEWLEPEHHCLLPESAVRKGAEQWKRLGGELLP